MYNKNMRLGLEADLLELRDSPQGRAITAIRDELNGLHRLGITGLEPVQVTAFVRAAQGVVDQLELLTARGVAYLFARQLDRLSDTAAGLSSGTVSFADAAVVAKNTAKARPEDVGRVEAMILAKTGEMPPGLLRHEGRAILGEVDSEALRRDSARAHERRSVRIGPNVDGLSTISGYLTSLCAEELRAGLEPYMLPVDRHDRRTAEQRRHDGLHQLCRRSGVATREGRAAVATAERQALQGIIPISQEELDTILDDANISVAIKNMKGNLAYVGRSARSYSKPKRRAMLAVSPTCAFEGCTRPAADCTGHHIVEFSRGGETTVDTQAPLCYAHQDRVHRDGWVVLRQSESGFRTLPPGHPDNPRDGMSPEDYRRRRREAIFRREKTNGKPSARAGRNGVRDALDLPTPAQPRAGPHPAG